MIVRDISNRIALNTRSEKAYNVLMKKLDNRGFTWSTGRKTTSLYKFSENGRKTVIYIDTDNYFILYGSLDDYELINNKDTIKVFKPKDDLILKD